MHALMEMKNSNPNANTLGSSWLALYLSLHMSSTSYDSGASGDAYLSQVHQTNSKMPKPQTSN
jgi:hypothetical protein